jgi:hypothetical protein
MPVVVTLRTVLATPNAHHRAVAQRICDAAQYVVVLSRTAKELLQRVYGVQSGRIRVIPHGVPDVQFQPAARSKARLGIGGRTLISTLGLLSRGRSRIAFIRRRLGDIRTELSSPTTAICQQVRPDNLPKTADHTTYYNTDD